MKIFFSAGEVSGDINGAELVKSFKERNIETIGIGGINMLREGLKSPFPDQSTKNTLGVIEALRFLFPRISLFFKARDYLVKERPSALILIDNMGFNIPFGKFAKKKGIKTFYYFPPNVSMWGEWNAPTVLNSSHLVLCTFKSDYEVYKKYGENVVYVGNPLVDRVKSIKPLGIDELVNVYGIDIVGKTKIALLPGSRYQEIKSLSPFIYKSVELLNKRHHSLYFFLFVAHKDFLPYFKKVFSDIPNIAYVVEDRERVLPLMDFAITASGTATLELALMNVPMVVLYKLSYLSYFVAKMVVSERLRKVGGVSLANIVLGEYVVPELLQNFSAESIVSALEGIMGREEEIKGKLKRVWEVMDGGTVGKVTKIVLGTLDNAQSNVQ